MVIQEKSDIFWRVFVSRKPRFMPVLKANYRIITWYPTNIFRTRYITEVAFLSLSRCRLCESMELYG